MDKLYIQSVVSILVCFGLLFNTSLKAQDLCTPVGWVTQNGGVTGGGNATPTVVSNYDDLKAAITSTTVKVVHISGVIKFPSAGRISFQDQSGKTLYGLPGCRLVSSDLTKDGSGIMYVKRCNNVIIRNITFEGAGAYDVDGWDDMTLDNSTNIWVDHCEFGDGVDGCLDVKNASDFISITWCKFIYNKAPIPGGSGGSDDHRFTNLFGSGDDATQDRGKLRITLQHCWWATGCKARMPRVRFGKVHVVNNYFNSTASAYCVQTGFEADVLVESNVFENVKNPIDLMNNTYTAVTVRNNTFTNTTGNTAGNGTAFTPPYSLTINPASQVKSMVTAGAGATLTSPTCSGTNKSPTVSITSPANNATFMAPASVTINATAADADGTVVKVDFYNGTTLIGTDASSPYSFVWTNVTAGTYAITAKATDNSGAVTTSAAITITVTAPVNIFPTVSITLPANGATFTSPASVTINATATDADGSITKVDFYNGATLIGTDASSPYSFVWTNVTAGTYTITAKATDNSGAVTTSTAITITVTAPVNIFPTVSIPSPLNNATFTAPASVTINATATDADGNITKVDFYNGATLLGTDASSPYSFVWTNVVAGTYTITAKATDNSSAVTTSTAIAITVNPAGQAPTVSITSPVNNATFTSPANIIIDAIAADADGTITKVDFYNGTTLLGTDATSPYSFTWTSVAAGTYSITAKATDNSGAVTTSSAIIVVVNGIPGTDVTIQAETACEMVGVLETKNAGFNGASYVNVDNSVGTTITWSVNSTVSQTVNLTFRYAATTDRNMSLSVNGTMQVPVVALPSTGAFTTWNTSVVSITLAAGTNKIEVASLTTDGGPNIDELSFNSPNITIGSCSQAPTVSITSPASNATFTAPASVTINTTATDADGSITKVDFYNGATLLGTDASSPYSFVWTNVTAGTYTITAKATDNSGAVTTSTAITITVTAPVNLFPTVSITSPLNNATFTAPASVTINATAADADGNVTKVDFYNGTTLLGTDATSPYSFAFNNLSAGTYTLTAVATDNLGTATTSTVINITVNPNQSSVINIVSPINNSTLAGPSVTIDVNATDPDGSITKVEYLDGTTVIGTSTTQPYTFTWNNPDAGTHVITVRVTDSNGGVTISSSTTVTIGTGTGIISSSYGVFTRVYPNPSLEAFTIRASQGIKNLSVVDMYGQEVIILQDISADQQIEIGRDLAEGTYVLLIKYTSDKIEVAKMVKIK